MWEYVWKFCFLVTETNLSLAEIALKKLEIHYYYLIKNSYNINKKDFYKKYSTSLKEAFLKTLSKNKFFFCWWWLSGQNKKIFIFWLNDYDVYMGK
jgi:hypothetical protein